MADTMLLSSAVRLPTPPPGGSYSPGPSGARKRSPPSRSPSPRRRRPAPSEDDRRRKTDGADQEREMDDRERQLMARFKPKKIEDTSRKPLTAEEKQAAAKAEYEKLLNMRSGGTYIPPARLRALQAEITDKTSKEYQRMAWEALKKSINGLINKINVSNIKYIVPELFGENLVRGRGLFCRSIMKAQAASLPFTPIYAAMAAIVNTKLPQVGELLLNRLVVQFRKAFKRNDKAVCISSTTFIAHLCNQQVAHETVAAQLLLLLLHKPTDDSVEIAVGLTREVGQHLEEMSQPIALAVFDQFRSILHEADIDKRTQYMIEVLFQVRKDRYKDNPAIREELDLVEEEDQITHQVDLDDDIDTQDTLNIFKFDPEWEEHEEAYRKLKAEILGEDSGDEEEGESGSDVESTDDEEAEQERAIEIKDQTNTDLVNLRRTIYLTIMSSLDFEEACHKLMKVQLPAGQEPELPSMIIECCSQEKTYSKFFGLVGERFAKLNRLWTDLFEQAFAKYYDTIHRYETNRLRNIARFFGHLLSTDAIGWHVFSVVHLNEDETTSSSRIFIKILFQDLAEALGMPKLQAHMKDDILRPSFSGIFPTDNPRNTRFSINYFTSIGMGALTEEMREYLKNLPRPEIPALPVPKDDVSDSETTRPAGHTPEAQPQTDGESNPAGREVRLPATQGEEEDAAIVARSHAHAHHRHHRAGRESELTAHPSRGQGLHLDEERRRPGGEDRLHTLHLAALHHDESPLLLEVDHAHDRGATATLVIRVLALALLRHLLREVSRLVGRDTHHPRPLHSHADPAHPDDGGMPHRHDHRHVRAPHHASLDETLRPLPLPLPLQPASATPAAHLHDHDHDHSRAHALRHRDAGSMLDQDHSHAVQAEVEVEVRRHVERHHQGKEGIHPVSARCRGRHLLLHQEEDPDPPMREHRPLGKEKEPHARRVPFDHEMALGDAIRVQRQEQVAGQELQTLTELLSSSAESMQT
ncbi:pre-mRNA-splicing factor cwc22 [Exophiala xenobiotica]|nr:pre-mRNA-splicing factor cwc22 [Exophiala xenobiotica]KAK5556701.1 pre-mRNA-splicing factor cwc22 [Exophiala xenobiotica]